MNFKKYFICTISLVPLACAAQSKTSEPSWVSKCKPLENAISEITKSGQFNLASIRMIHKINNETSGCDDGFYAEGMTDVVARSLAADFSNIAKSAKKDSQLVEFVSKHLNSSADWKDLDKVVIQSKNSCPSDATEFCKRIGGISKKASDEAKEVTKKSK